MFNHINTLPALLMNYHWSREQKWYRARVSTVSLLTCRKIEIVTSPWKRKLQGLLAEDALVQSCPERKILGDLISAGHKVLSEGCESRNNHRYAVVPQD